MEAHESTRKRLESALPKIMKITSRKKGLNSKSHDNLVHKFVPVPQAMKILDAEAAVSKLVASVAIVQGKQQKCGHS